MKARVRPSDSDFLFQTASLYTGARMSIQDNLERVRNEVADACSRAGRNLADVDLMAVSKMHPVEALLEAHAAGQRLFGENRVQEAQAKYPDLAALDGLDLHLIGPLQNNKTSKAAELFGSVDTLDTLKTAERLNTAAAALGKQLPVLIEVKLSHEESKHGLAADDLASLLESMAPLTHVHAAGLMTVPPWSENPEAARPYFVQLRALRDRYLERFPALTQLSMGMSMDFRVAIEEGSTCVRIGTSIFGKRDASAA